MIKIRNDSRETVFINPEHIVAISYRKKHDTLSVSAKLVIQTIKHELVYDGTIAEAVFGSIHTQREDDG